MYFPQLAVTKRKKAASDMAFRGGKSLGRTSQEVGRLMFPHYARFLVPSLPDL